MQPETATEQRHVSGIAAVMTVLAMGLGYAISIGDPTTLSANLQVVSAGLGITGSTATFIASLATLTMAAAIAAYFGVGYTVSTPLPALGGTLAHAIGWRATFFLVPVIAAIGLIITWRFVPETLRSSRRLDIPGMALFAVALLSFIYGMSRIETGIDAIGLTCIAAGLAAGIAFVVRERSTDHPALDMRVFQSSRFNAAVAAGVVFNIVLGGSMILLAFYLTTIRKESHELFGYLLMPATAMAALAALSAGPVANKFGARTVMVTGLVLMLGGLVVLHSYTLDTTRVTVFVTAALMVIGGALVTTPQAMIMMNSAPADLGGAVSAVKSAVNEGGYSLGPALFALVGINLFLTDSAHDLSREGINRNETREALVTAHGGHSGATLVNPEQARLIVDQAPHNAIDAIHTLSLILAAGPVIAIILALWLIKPSR